LTKQPFKGSIFKDFGQQSIVIFEKEYFLLHKRTTIEKLEITVSINKQNALMLVKTSKAMFVGICQATANGFRNQIPQKCLNAMQNTAAYLIELGY
jgi:hypothetical protein